MVARSVILLAFYINLDPRLSAKKTKASAYNNILHWYFIFRYSLGHIILALNIACDNDNK